MKIKARYLITAIIIVILSGILFFLDKYESTQNQVSSSDIPTINVLANKQQDHDSKVTTNNTVLENKSDSPNPLNHVMSNLVGNLQNGGHVLEVNGQLLYYSYFDNELHIDALKVKTDRPMMSMNFYNDWIYYSSFGTISKTRFDGTETTEVIKVRTSHMQVVGDWIYYIDEPDFPISLNKIKIDGSQNMEIIKGKIYSFIVDGDWIYYSDGDLKKIRTDGSELIKLNEDNADFLNIHNEILYYMNSSDNFKIYSVELNGNNKSVLLDKSIYNFNMTNDWIFFAQEKDQPFFKIRTDGTDLTKISDDWAREIYIINDELVIRSWPKDVDVGDGPLVAMDFNGGNRKILLQE